MSDKSIEAGKWQMHSQRWPDSCGCFGDLLWIENPQNPPPLPPSISENTSGNIHFNDSFPPELAGIELESKRQKYEIDISIIQIHF